MDRCTLLVLAITLLQSSAINRQDAVVSGQVIADDTGQPIPSVRVLALEVNALSGRVVVSDPDGFFTIRFDPATTKIVIKKPGFVSEERVVTRDTKNVDVRLVRAAVIAGRVLDELGEPVVDAAVAITSTRSGQDVARDGITARTDDRGEYRMGGLRPGTYLARVEIPQQPRRAALGAPVRDASARTRHARYYPTADSARDALPLTLSAGDARTTVDFVVPSQQTDEQPLSALSEVFTSPGAPALHFHQENPGVVTGSVVGPDHEPLAYAQVVIMGVLQTRTQPRVIRAASDGTFVMSGVPRGYYQLRASKVGYLPSAPESGAEPSLVFIDNRARAAAVLIRLKRWSVLSGQVTDGDGDPMAGVRVQLLQLRYERARRQYVPASLSAQTDDTGAYRIYGVRAGSYIVRATPTQLPGYVPTFLPGTSLPSDAREVRLSDGETMRDVDMSMERGRTVNIRGRIVDPNGAVALGNAVTLVAATTTRVALGVTVPGRVQPNGTFEFQNVVPGDYVIHAYNSRRTFWSEGQFGAVRVVVRDADIDDLLLYMRSGTVVSGTVNFETTGRPPKDAPSGLQVVAVPTDMDMFPVANWARARIERDGTFQMVVLDGPRRLEVTEVPSGWSVKDIRLGNTDISDRVLDLRPSTQSISGVVVTLTNQITTLSGRVTSRDPSTNRRTAYVLAFSEDPSRWYDRSRFVRMATAPSLTGRYRFDGLPPGRYHTVAVPALPTHGDEAWRDPIFLEGCFARSSRVTLREGETRSAHDLDLVADSLC